MKILYVYDIAGDAFLYAKLLRKAGHQADVLNQHDPFGFTEFYGGRKATEQEIIDAAKDYDILHVTSVYQMLPRLAFLKKPMLIHYVGTELVLTEPLIINLHNRYAAKVAVVNSYLKKYTDAVHIPCCADTDHFYPDGIGDGTLTFGMDYLDMSQLKYPEMLYIHDRNTRPIPYRELPAFLREYDSYIDIKHDKFYGGILPAYSKTGLECLALGMRVLNYQNKWATEPPAENTERYVTNSLIEIYESML